MTRPAAYRPTEAGSTIETAKEATVKTPRDDIGFDVPLYTVTEAARFLGVPPTTFANWARGYTVGPPGRKAVIGQPIVTAVPASRNYPAVPFVGLAEGLVVAA